MLRTIDDYMGDVRSYFSEIQAAENFALVWKSMQLISGECDLPFMVSEARIVTEAPYRTGTLTIVGGTAVTLTGGVLDTTWKNRKVIIGGRSERYRVTAIGTTTTFTLAEAYLGTDTTDLTYTMFRDIYELPADCEFAKEIVVFDLTRREELCFVDYEQLVHDRERNSGRTGRPLRVARVNLDADGKAQLLFDPPPDNVYVYLVPYYRAAKKPATPTSPLDPPWPNAFHDIIPLRAVAEYADRKGHPRRREFRERFRVRMARMRSQFDGGNELHRRLRDRFADGSVGVFVGMRE